MDEYTILQVQERNRWNSKFGEMQDYALQLKRNSTQQNENGWIQLSQKVTTPPPVVNSTITGNIEPIVRNGQTYFKFRKQNPNFQGNRSDGSGSGGGSQAPSGRNISDEKLDYIVLMLEELTGRRDVVHETKEEPLEDPFEGIL